MKKSEVNRIAQAKSFVKMDELAVMHASGQLMKYLFESGKITYVHINSLDGSEIRQTRHLNIQMQISVREKLRCELCGLINGPKLQNIWALQKSNGISIFICRPCAIDHFQICPFCTDYHLERKKQLPLRVDLHSRLPSIAQNDNICIVKQAFNSTNNVSSNFIILTGIYW